MSQEPFLGTLLLYPRPRGGKNQPGGRGPGGGPGSDSVRFPHNPTHEARGGDGVNYHFVTEQQFLALMGEGVFLEHAQVLITTTAPPVAGWMSSSNLAVT